MSPWCSGALLALLPIAAGLCEDAQTDNDRASCASWAKDGECDRNPDYMRLNCAASCGFCSTPPPTSDGHSSTILIETLLAKLKTARAWPPAQLASLRAGLDPDGDGLVDAEDVNVRKSLLDPLDQAAVFRRKEHQLHDRFSLRMVSAGGMRAWIC